MNRFNMNRRVLTAALYVGVLTGFSACSAFQPVSYDCAQKVSAPEIGSRISLPAETGAISTVRLNGVSAVCVEDGEQIDIEMAIGLKVSRAKEDSVPPLLLEVPFIAAIIDSDEKVVGHESFSYRMAFGDYVETIYPLTRQNVSIPQGGRIVISLVPKRIEVK